MKRPILILIFAVLYACNSETSPTVKHDTRIRDSLYTVHRFQDLGKYLDKGDYRTSLYVANDIIKESPKSPEADSCKHIVEWINKQMILNPASYQILDKEEHGNTTTYYIFYKGKTIKPKVTSFIKKFLFHNCVGQCNIYLYDSPSVKSLVSKYPTTIAEDKILTRHRIAIKTFDVEEVYVRE